MKLLALVCLLVTVGFLPAFSEDLDTASLQKQSAQGNPDAEFKLGRAYQHGEGIPQDYARAAALYRKAADQGNAKAMHNLGVLYEQGQGVKRDPAEALKWYRQGPFHGHSMVREGRRSRLGRCAA
jgi:TPR repeat protein